MQTHRPRRALKSAAVAALLCMGAAITIAAPVEKASENDATAFPLMTEKDRATVYFDENDSKTVKTVANLFADDVERVTGKRPTVSTGKPKAKIAVIVGTVDGNRWIRELSEKKKVDASAMRGQWERFVLATVENPFPGVEEALIVAGSDRRGAAYGLLSISEAIGVSPLYWWSDVPVRRAKEVRLKRPISHVSKSPSVQYRGFFINDEGWGFRPWAASTLDKDRKNVGPKTYEKVCELILRMKGNFLAPAMHPGTSAFNKYPENKVVADRFGIVMGTSHCEPLLFNNTTEWDRKTMGEWDYLKNRDGILKVLDKRVRENAPYENVYTMGIRGIHDAGMIGVPDERKVEVMERVIKDERDILTKHIKKPAEEIPQIFVPYKEVLEIYNRGVKIPDDITLMWADDNYGYIRRLSDEKERKRKGGAGVYYHISYLGGPHDYLWLTTTPPALMYEELKKAYDLGAKRVWLLNVGDIKPGELGLKTFFDMSWDIGSLDYDSINRHQPEFLAGIFGEEFREELQDVMSTYYLLAFQRKPEMMAGGRQWNCGINKGNERLCDTNFSFVNYDEADRRIREYARIAKICDDIEKRLPEEFRPAFYHLVQYPVKGSALINAKMLLAQKNRWHARQGRASANVLAEQVKRLHEEIDRSTARYNSQSNGKWNRMMELTSSWGAARHMDMPPLDKVELPESAPFGVFVPNDGPDGNAAVRVLPTLNPYTDRSTFIEVYNKSRTPFPWTAKASEPWIKLDKTSGTTALQDRIGVSVDWANAPKKGFASGRIEIVSGEQVETVHLPIFQPVAPTRDSLRGLFVEDDGVVSIDPAKFSRKHEGRNIAMTPIFGLRNPNGSVQVGTPGMPTQGTWDPNRTPRVEYDFHSFSAGPACVQVHFLPTFPATGKARGRIGVMIDNSLIKTLELDLRNAEDSGEWHEGVLWNNIVKTAEITVEKPGRHTLKLLCIDPGVIVNKIVVDFGGLKPSANGPDSTLVK